MKCRKARNNFATKHQQRTAVCRGSAILMSLRKRIKGKGSCGMRFRNSSKGKLIEKFIILISFNYSSLYKYYHIFIIFSI